MTDRGDQSRRKRPSVFWAGTGRWLWSGSGASLDRLLGQTERYVGSQGQFPGIGKRWLRIVGDMKNDRFGEDGLRTERDADGWNFVITQGFGDKAEAQQPNILTALGKMLRFPEPLDFQSHGTFGQSVNRRLGIPDGDQQLELLTGF